MKTIELRTQIVCLDEAEGILLCTVTPGAVIEEADADEGVAALIEVSNGKVWPLLVDIRALKSINRGARKRFGEARVSSAVALVVGSPLNRAVGNFFLGLNRPVVPARLFNSIDEGRAWLASLTT